MRTPKILNNDLVLSNKTFTMAEDVDALAEVMSARLKLWKGEWFAAPDSGIDYFSLFQNKQLLQQKARKVYKDAIIADTRILKLNELELTYDNATRTMTGEFNAETTEGLLEATI